jgi:hypothetical protein
LYKSLFDTKKPVFDPALGTVLGKIILGEARQGKVDTLLKEVVKMRSGQWDKRAFYVDLTGEHLTNAKNIETLSDTPIGNLLKGNVAINLAWKARGGGQADTVSKEGWNLFFKHLNYAGRYLLRAGEQDKEDPTPFAFLQTVAMGLQLDHKIAEAWLNEAIKRDATNQQAHFRHLFLLCKKWGGSHEDMFAFARATVKKIPPDSTLNSIIYLAFQENLLYFKAFENNPQSAKALLLDKWVREESIAIYEKSMQKRKKIEQVSDYWPHNVTAWWFLALRIPEVVRQETKKIGPNFTRFPWSIFFRDPADGYYRATKI